MTNILNIQLPIFKLNPIAISREDDRVKIIFALKSWKSWCVSVFDASKKGLKSFVKSSEKILRSGKIELCNAFIEAADFFKCICLIVVIDRFAPLFVTDNSLLKRTIIEKASRIKKLVKFGFLSFICEQPVFKGLSHLLSKNPSIARRMSSATFKPVFVASSFSRLICPSVRYVSIRFIRLIYILFVCMSTTILRKQGGLSSAT